MTKKITVTIDSKLISVPAGTTILEAAAMLGIEIPTLCHKDGLDPFTSCFLCIVEVEGEANPVPSCSTAVSDGMKIHTNSERIRSTRKMALELLLSEHCGDCIAPCTLNCPAECNVQSFIQYIAEGDEKRAIEIIREALPFPIALGRICPKPCEVSCRRICVEEPVAIGWLHWYAAEASAANCKTCRPKPGRKSGKSVAIIGGGPAGISAAYFLRKIGHAVTIFEAKSEIGGMLRWGIPAYRLPKDILQAEIEAIVEMGIEIHFSQRWGHDFSIADLKKQGFDAIFIAPGAPNSTPLRVKGEHLKGVIGGIEFLDKIAHGEKIKLPEKTVVVGGGNTAVDCARTARRLGAEKVIILYRRTRAEMPALDIEVKEAEEEGIQIQFLAAPANISQKNNHLILSCQKMRLGSPDSSGRRRPIPIEGEISEIRAGTIIAAIGQELDSALLRKERIELDQKGKKILVNPQTFQTSLPWLFAGGDATASTAQRIAAWSVGSGHKAAIAIDEYLTGKPVKGEPAKFTVSMGEKPEQVTASRFTGIEHASRVRMAYEEAKQRVKNFQPVEMGLKRKEARLEAQRCLACGCTLPDDCKLRKYAAEYQADPYRFTGAKRDYTVNTKHPLLIVESGKCINCGICVRMEQGDEKKTVFGFVDRGFNSSVKPYFRVSSEKLNADSASINYVDACPTCAIVKRADFGAHTRFAHEKGVNLD